MPTVTKSLGGGTQSVLLTIAILERLASKEGPVSISELARDIGTSKSRIFRHLQTLMSCNYVANRGGSGEYEAGSQLLAFCRAINERFDLIEVARPTMEELQERLGHTVIVSRVEPDGIRVLKSMSGRSTIVVAVKAGSLLRFLSSAQGKAALAFMPETRLDPGSAISEAYRRFEMESGDELAQIRRQGWASGQMREGLIGFGAPVANAAGVPVATLGLLDTIEEIGPGLHESRGAELAKAAKALSRKLGAARLD